MAARPYRVWCPDRGQTEDDAKLITADGVRSAASEFAENHAGFSGDPFSELEVLVRAAGSTLVHHVVVEVEVVPSFYAHLGETELIPEHAPEVSDG